jgi:peptidoglycan/LPS O-acetylase OafA/YrhL
VVVDLEYRKDIDGLRGLSVLLVVLYHCGFTIFSGGFVGVDVFFVISGYLITTIVFSELENNKFTFIKFYKRRAIRLLPALNVMLLLVLLFGFFFYTNKSFDVLGKEITFSALGLANILFAQGVDYFASEDAYKPLIHLWSLGVEEQFYVIWPLIMLLSYKFSKNIGFSIFICFILFIFSLFSSEVNLQHDAVKTYFYPQYRIFELLIGAGLGLILFKTDKLFLAHYRAPLAVLGLFFILYSGISFSKNTSFPGLNALIPCFGTLLIIMYSKGSIVERVLSSQVLFFLGVISYPLYLYHQPILSFIYYFKNNLPPSIIFISVMLLAIPLSWVTYAYIEKPIRSLNNRKGKLSKYIPLLLVVITLIISAIGLYIAKNQGLEWRFKLLNSFSYEVSNKSASSFHTDFSRGIHRSDKSDILFFGDSVLQNYVLPISRSLDIPLSNVSTITRGGCVLLKGVEFLDKFSDVSCDSLRKELYRDTKVYNRVVFSQSWLAYDESLLNVSIEKGDGYTLEKWNRYLLSTIKHFSDLGSEVIVIADHPSVIGTASLQPSIFLDQNSYAYDLKRVKITNHSDMLENDKYFREQFSLFASLIYPVDIWCRDSCVAHDGSWSFFSDSQHLTVASNDFVVKRLKSIFSKENVSLQEE